MRRRQKFIAENYTYTKEDIEKLVEEKKKRKGVTNIGLAKTKIDAEIKAVQAEVDACRQRVKEVTDSQSESIYDDDDEPREIRQAKAMLKSAEEKLANKNEEKKRIFIAEKKRINTLKSSARVQNWERVNELAKAENQTADFESYKQRQIEAAEKAERTEFDPFARRKVKPKLLWEVGGNDKEESNPESAPESSQKVDSRLPPKEDANQGEGKENIALQSQAKPDVQFAIDEEAWAKRSVIDMVNGDETKSSYLFKNQIRRGLSLVEYQERKAAGTL